MIRFIDLGDQIFEGQRGFAWWDTVTDTFETYNYEQVWETWLEFETAYRHDQAQVIITNLASSRSLERYKRLFPKDWSGTFVSAEDRKKRYEQGICDDVVDCSAIPDPKKLMKQKKKLDKLLKKP